MDMGWACRATRDLGQHDKARGTEKSFGILPIRLGDEQTLSGHLHPIQLKLYAFPDVPMINSAIDAFCCVNAVVTSKIFGEMKYYPNLKTAGLDRTPKVCQDVGPVVTSNQRT